MELGIVMLIVLTAVGYISWRVRKHREETEASKRMKRIARMAKNESRTDRP